MHTGAPIDVATRHTLEFMSGVLGPRSAIIEVGCGAGHLAEALNAAGHAVLAIDADANNVAAVKARGLTAIVACWPDCAGTPADALAFTRSLHHISPLSQAVAHARAMLRDGAALIVEDFAHDRAEPRDVAWLREQLGTARSRGWLADDARGLAGALLAASDPMEAWRRNHVEGVHASGEMRAAITQVFGPTREETAPYLYRYAIPWLVQTHEATAWVEAVLDEERRRIERGELRPIGLRFVVSRTRPRGPFAPAR